MHTIHMQYRVGCQYNCVVFLHAVPEVPVVRIIPSYFNESGMLAQIELSLAPGKQSEVLDIFIVL